MTVELKEFRENGKTFLAVGYIDYDRNAHLNFYAVRADGKENWFSKYEDALAFIAVGIKKPTPTWTLEN